MEKSNKLKSSDAAGDTSRGHLSLRVKPKLIPFFFQFLGHGFSVSVRTGCSVKDMLCKQIGIHEDYLAQRIQTIFLNAKVVDDVNSAMVPENSTLALSGAMPGLVGAILRSGGFYAGMRSQISYNKDTSSSQPRTAKITLKLLNLVVKELGPTFLQKGIWVNGQELLKFLKHHSAVLEAGCLSGELDSKPFALSTVQKIHWNSDLVFLQITSADSS